MRTIKANSYSELITFYKENPTQFLEDCFNIKISKSQKAFINNKMKFCPVPLFSRQKGYYYEYIQLLICLLNIKENSNITIILPNKEKILNREQFIDYIVEFKNQHFKSEKER